MTDSNTLDMSVIHALKDMGEDFFADLVATFQEDSVLYIQQLETALPAGDVETFRRAAHTLKSNANNFGASGMAEVARELEILGRENRLDAVGNQIAVLKAEFENTSRALQAL